MTSQADVNQSGESCASTIDLYVLAEYVPHVDACGQPVVRFLVECTEIKGHGGCHIGFNPLNDASMLWPDEDANS
jgi:hypothetical protein